MEIDRVGDGVSPSRSCATHLPFGQIFPLPGAPKKKTPTMRPGWEAYLLSHIKAPAQGGKAGSGEPPAHNLANSRARFKCWLAIADGVGSAKGLIPVPPMRQ